MKHISYGSAPAGFKIAAAVKDRLNLEHLQHGYGMTEMGYTHLTAQDVFKPESVAMTFAHNMCKIVDNETGTALSPGNPGELVVQGPQVLIV